jgi:hypothetical protein
LKFFVDCPGSVGNGWRKIKIPSFSTLTGGSAGHPLFNFVPNAITKLSDEFFQEIIFFDSEGSLLLMAVSGRSEGRREWRKKVIFHEKGKCDFLFGLCESEKCGSPKRRWRIRRELGILYSGEEFTGVTDLNMGVLRNSARYERGRMEMAGWPYFREF